MNNSANPKKVLHILCELRHSGAEVMIRDANGVFNEHNLETHILGTGPIPGEFADELQARGYTIHHIPFQRTLGYFKKVNQFLKEHRFDVVHIHPEQAFVYYAFLTYLNRVPRVVSSIHNVFVYHKAMLARRVVHTWLTEKVFGVQRLAIGEAVFNNERRYTSQPIILHNWINTNLFVPISETEKNQRRAELGLSPTDFVLIMVGGCSKVKNHQRVFELMAQLPPGYEHVKCLHIGTGEAEAAEKACCETHQLRDRVQFLGTRQDVYRYMQVADLHVLPSLYEGVGNVYLEASACKLLSLVNDGPGLREVIQFGKAGVIADVSTDQFRQTIIDIVDNPTAYQHIAEAAYQLVMNRHRLDTNARQLVGLYQVA
ncbi:glycosyl transferase group 1 [Fibrella aestuarina BUZ 2]|uniref:Glycosyl transferase group 1 n=1 Tax=Fibrella aestuarina BUZ 2 TaxID=1166018 RepID=I0K3W0_9BACT|nr:glycosyltransferase family 4 protein [Fibrella aestuarina]CCG98813.1 glycosyl transferase group 1 [Fibrella aestuarina BUZ 2]